MNEIYNANIYSQFTVIYYVTFATVTWHWSSQPTAVHMKLTDIKEYSLRLVATWSCNVCSQITVANVTIRKTVQGRPYVFTRYWWLTISKLVEPGNSYTPLFKALNTVVDQSIYDIWIKIAMAGSRWVLVKTVGLILAHQTLMIHHFYGNWPRNKLHTSLESPE